MIKSNGSFFPIVVGECITKSNFTKVESKDRSQTLSKLASYLRGKVCKADVLRVVDGDRLDPAENNVLGYLYAQTPHA